MPDRRQNPEVEVTIEYALFMAEIRGPKASVHFLDSCATLHAVVQRILRYPEQRRTRERRVCPRH